jgi:hypothetical protein
MRAVLAVLILVAAVALTSAEAYACGSTDADAFFFPFFIGDGFDNTTCADAAPLQGCH